MIKVKGINDNEVGDEPRNQARDQLRDHAQGSECQPSDLETQALLAKRLGAAVEITGQWAWASWQSRPSPEIRQALKDNGWLWCHNKGKWAWRAEPSHSRRAMPWDYIVAKYGLRELEREAQLVEV